ncbi:hypothetical protein HYW83_04430 [Candidatus Peregrinibacteria bacterium]|nr:hypothetical protein [Candidatus Peregrinibacteria bacterium]
MDRTRSVEVHSDALTSSEAPQTAPDSAARIRIGIAFLAAMAVFGVKRAQAQPTGGGSKSKAEDAIYLSCPDKDPEQIGWSELNVPDECADGRIEVRCAKPRISAAWDIPAVPLDSGPGVSLPVKFLRGGSIAVSCEGDHGNDGRTLDILPPTRTDDLPKPDSVQVREHPSVREAETQSQRARSNLIFFDREVVQAGRDLLAARQKLSAATKQHELKKRPVTLLAVREAEAAYMKAMEERVKARAAYEAAQKEFDRSVEVYAATVKRVLLQLEAEARKEPHPRAPNLPAGKTKPSAGLVSAPSAATSAHSRVGISGGASASLFSTQDRLVRSPGFFLELDTHGLLARYPNAAIQFGVRYAPVAQSLSRMDRDFVPRDPDARLSGFLATLDARVSRNFPFASLGSVRLAFQPSTGLGVGVLRTQRGVDAGVSTANRRDLADIPAATKFFPLTAAGARIVATRGSLALALGADGMVSAFPTQTSAGAPDNSKSLVADVAATLSAGYKF